MYLLLLNWNGLLKLFFIVMFLKVNWYVFCLLLKLLFGLYRLLFIKLFSEFMLILFMFISIFLLKFWNVKLIFSLVFLRMLLFGFEILLFLLVVDLGVLLGVIDWYVLNLCIMLFVVVFIVGFNLVNRFCGLIVVFVYILFIGVMGVFVVICGVVVFFCFFVVLFCCFIDVLWDMGVVVRLGLFMGVWFCLERLLFMVGVEMGLFCLLSFSVVVMFFCMKVIGFWNGWMCFFCLCMLSVFLFLKFIDICL